MFELLESRGFDVKLVNAGHIKNVPGRKTDVLDCQWIQELHTFGLLSGSFRPEESVCVLRAYLRQRANLVRYAGVHIQHMQKALNQMNLQLHHVIDDITGGERIGSGKTIPSANRAAAAFRLAARPLHASHSALGGFFRRQRARLGSPEAITAAAHKLATIFYSMLKNKTEYDAPDINYYETQYRKRVLANLKKRAAMPGFDLIERPSADVQSAAV